MFQTVFYHLFLFRPGTNFIATLTLGGAGAHASYYHKANEQVSFYLFYIYLFIFLQQGESLNVVVALIMKSLVVCSCRLVWSLKSVLACRKQTYCLVTSWTSPKPICSLKVGEAQCFGLNLFTIHFSN